MSGPSTVTVFEASLMVLLVSVCEVFVLATSVNVLLPKAMVLLVSVIVFAAVSTFVGVMIPDSVAMIYSSACKALLPFAQVNYVFAFNNMHFVSGYNRR